MRTLLAQPSLAGRKVTLDAAHCNPLTTAQIHQAQGTSLVQLKANQPALLATARTRAATTVPLGTCQSVNKAHGRVEVRRATFFSCATLPLAPRWQPSGLGQLVRVERPTEQLTTAQQSQAVAYYVTNQAAATPAAHADLFAAIRGHWGCESDNWIRDVTLQEDQILVQQSSQAQVLSTLRTLALGLLRSTGVRNLRAMLDNLADSPALFTQLLCQVGFL